MASSTVDTLRVGETALARPLRNILLTFSLTVLSLAIAGSIWQQAGYEMLIVAMGWPHVLLGFAFYFGKVLRGEERTRVNFALLSMVTLALWGLHYYYAITGFIYLFFLYHAFRDEIFVYLQTRGRHRGIRNVYDQAGIGPLILLLLLVPNQQDFRQDLRRVEFTSEKQFAADGWSLISFRPVENSAGRHFYFYLQAPHTSGLHAYTTASTLLDLIPNGEILVGDHSWQQASDLVFVPEYDGASAPQRLPEAAVPVLLTGGHKVGQTFVAERNDLSGVWLPVNRVTEPQAAIRFVFHLASPPLLPYSKKFENLRLILLAALGAWVAWRLLPRANKGSQLWIYLLVLGGAFGITQTTLKTWSNAGYALPLIFQFVVVFHYWSWYVFSFDKFRSHASSGYVNGLSLGLYQRLLMLLRNKRNFTWTVVTLNLLSALFVFWYYQGNGTALLRYAFDYNFFLYFLVFHVTFSFNPKLPLLTKSAPA